MEKQKGITRLGLATIICTLTLILFSGYLAVQKVRNEACRMVCGANLNGLGTAMRVYTNDYDGSYPQLPGKGPWSKELGLAYDLAKPDFDGKQSNTARTITACWYLLVREDDVSPKSFICPQTNLMEFDGSNPANKDIVELWDFGKNPYEHVSYAYHNPYGKYPADGARSATFAIAADMSPWFNNGDIVPAGESNMPPQGIQFTNPTTWTLGNSLNHRPAGANAAEGQNVLYADGHTAWETQPNVGVKNDNIYTFWSAEENPTEQDRQGGTAPTGRGAENDAKSEDDSFLAI